MKTEFTQLNNVLLKEIMASDLSAGEHKVFLCVLRKTTGFHKKSDAIALSQFVKETLVSKQTIITVVEELVKISLLVVKKRKGCTNEYSINYGFTRSNREKYVSDKYKTSKDSFTCKDSLTGKDSLTPTSKDSQTATSKDSLTYKRNKEIKKEKKNSWASPKPNTPISEEAILELRACIERKFF